MEKYWYPAFRSLPTKMTSMKSLLLLMAAFAIYLLSCKKEECPTCTSCPVPVLPAAPTCVVKLDSGLLAYYPFNGNANDASGNGNNGLFNNGAGLTTDFIGRPNQAAGFGGGSSCMIVNDSGHVNSDTLTISLQLYTTNADGVYGVISRQDYNTAKGYTWGLAQAETNTRKLAFSLAPNDDCGVVKLYDQSIAVYSGITVSNERWHHVMLTFANKEQKIYIDGTLAGTKTRDFSNTKKCTNTQLILGNWWKDAPYGLIGKLDEVRIYKRLLNDCELAELNRDFATAN
jgi:hypothetical protein